MFKNWILCICIHFEIGDNSECVQIKLKLLRKWGKGGKANHQYVLACQPSFFLQENLKLNDYTSDL